MSHVVIPSNIGINLLAIKYNAGAVWEQPGKRGTSHLMEHLMCKTFDDLLLDLKTVNIDYNAYTHHNSVVFYISGLDIDVKEYAQIILDRITKQEILWTEEGFEHEKQTVLQEYADAFNDPFGGAIENLRRKYYNYCNAIGFKEDIEKFTYQDSLAAAEAFKKPCKIIEVGDNSIKFDGEYDTRTLPSNVLKFGNYDIELETISTNNKSFVFLLGKKIFDLSLTSRINFVINCLNDGLESPLFQEIREKRGLSYFSYGWANCIGQDNLITFCASTGKEQAEELQNVYKTFFSSKPEELISEKRFDACKKQLLRSKIKDERLPHEGIVNMELGSFNPYEYIDQIKYEEVLSLFNEYLTIDNFHMITE